MDLRGCGVRGADDLLTVVATESMTPITPLSGAKGPLLEAPRPAPARRPHWSELDVLRGLAAVLMVSNHAGVRMPRGEGHGLADALEFAGSLAPVVFFTVTGLGRGVQSAASATRRPWRETLQKVLLLLLADAALWLAPGRPIGMDFLGFIGLSTLVVEAIARCARPQSMALLACAAVLLLRVVGAPLLRHAVGSGPWLFGLGDHGLAGFSYPPCPWLAYPLLGFAVGHAAQQHSTRLRSREPRVIAGCALLGVALGAVCVAMALHGSLFFRWGTVSVAFTVLSLATVFASLAVAMGCTRQPRVTRALALPGTSSLVVVPVHYGLIEIAVQTLPADLTTNYFPLVAAALVALALLLARALDRRIVRTISTRAHTTAWWALLACALSLLAATYATHGTAWRLPCMMTAQFVLCAMFAIRGKK